MRSDQGGNEADYFNAGEIVSAVGGGLDQSLESLPLDGGLIVAQWPGSGLPQSREPKQLIERGANAVRGLVVKLVGVLAACGVGFCFLVSGQSGVEAKALAAGQHLGEQIEVGTLDGLSVGRRLVPFLDIERAHDGGGFIEIVAPVAPQRQPMADKQSYEEGDQSDCFAWHKLLLYSCMFVLGVFLPLALADDRDRRRAKFNPTARQRNGNWPPARSPSPPSPDRGSAGK